MAEGKNKERSSDSNQTSPRWWPALLIAGLSSAALTFLWFFTDTMRQYKFFQTYSILFLTAMMLLAWALTFSRFRLRVKVGILSVAAALVVLGVTLFQIVGVSGDFVPVIDWRWRARPGRAVAVDLSQEKSLVPPEVSQNIEVFGSRHPYPQFLGPHRNATLSGPKLARDWQKRPPRRVWQREVGAGWSAFAVIDDRAITQEQLGEDETVTAYSLATGDLLWLHADRVRYESIIAGVGPRATPSVDGDRVYTLGATGLLNCLDLEHGEKVWGKDILKENGADLSSTEWGKSCSPLVVRDLVVVSAGGTDGRSLVAYNKETGETAWHGGHDHSSYSSPLFTRLAEQPQIVIFNKGSVAGHDPEDGRLLWEHPWQGANPNVAQPLPVGADRLFVSSGYGVGCKLFQVESMRPGEFRARVLWENRNLKAKFTNVVLYNGFIYGLDDGILVCLESATGERRWKKGRYGHGQLILVNDLLLILSESGTAALVEASPEAHRELSEQRLFDEKTWNCPALAGRYLLVRNDRHAACWELPLEE